jgi:hypothetical protein
MYMARSAREMVSANGSPPLRSASPAENVMVS